MWLLWLCKLADFLSSFVGVCAVLLSFSFSCSAPLFCLPPPPSMCPFSFPEQPVDHSLPIPWILSEQQLCFQLPASMAPQPNHKPGKRCLPPMVRCTQSYVLTQLHKLHCTSNIHSKIWECREEQLFGVFLAKLTLRSGSHDSWSLLHIFPNTHTKQGLSKLLSPLHFTSHSEPLSDFWKVCPTKTSSEYSKQLGNDTHCCYALITAFAHIWSAVVRQDAKLPCHCKCSCQPCRALIFQAFQFSSTKAK